MCSTALRRGLRWGAAPQDPADLAGFEASITGVDPMDSATPAADLAHAMAEALDNRLSAATAPADLPTVADHDAPAGTASSVNGLSQASLGVAGLAEQLSALVSPQTTLPILPHWTTAALREAVDDSATATRANPVPLAAQQASRFQDDWLTVVAATRPALARLEAQLLGPAGGLAIWGTGEDPWRRDQIAALLATDHTRKGDGFAVTPYTAVIGPDGALDAEELAVGVVDSYSEWLPMRARDSHAAFGFNAPRARAPQAILIAVSPERGTDLTADLLAIILSELRASLVARTASPDQMREVAAILPSVLVPHESPYQLFGPAVDFVAHM